VFKFFECYCPTIVCVNHFKQLFQTTNFFFRKPFCYDLQKKKFPVPRMKAPFI
jgi:hypothetical protein